jgi:hypothetical protein
MTPFETIVAVPSLTTPRSTECFGDNNDSLDGVVPNNDFVAMDPKDMQRQDIIWAWQDTTFDLYDRYNLIVAKMIELHKEFVDARKYIDELTVPHCWEVTRLSYSKMISELFAEFCSIDYQISSFPEEVDFHKNMVIHRADKGLSESSITFLENLLGFYADRTTTIEEQFTDAKKTGLKYEAESKIINNTCGYVDF